MVCQLSRTFQLQAILCQLQITPGTWINKLLSMKRPPLRDLLCKTSFNLCSACGGAASLLGSGRVTSGIRSWNVFGMCQEVKRNQCEKNTTGSFLIWSQAAFFTSRRDTPMCPALLLCSFFFFYEKSVKTIWSYKAWKWAVHNTWGWDQHIVIISLSSPSYRVTKVKLASLSQPTCTTARSLQGEYVFVNVRDNQSNQSEYLHI